MTEMVVKGFGTVNKNEQVGKKAFNENLYKYLGIIIGVFLVAAFVWSNMPLTKTVSNSIQTTTGVSTSDTSTESANPPQINNAEQEDTTTTSTAYLAKFREVTGKEGLVLNPAFLVPLNNIGKEIPVPYHFRSRGNGYTTLLITNLEAGNGKITGQLENRGAQVMGESLMVVLYTNNYNADVFDAYFRTPATSGSGTSSGPILSRNGKIQFEVSQRTLTPDRYKTFADMLSKTKYIAFAEGP